MKETVLMTAQITVRAFDGDGPAVTLVVVAEFSVEEVAKDGILTRKVSIGGRLVSVRERYEAENQKKTSLGLLSKLTQQIISHVRMHGSLTKVQGE